MTFRLDRIVEADVTILRVSGRISADDVDIFRAAVAEESGAIAIDLKDVSLVDGEAIRFLALMEASGCVLRGCPLFIREWIERERAQANSSESD